MLAAERGAVQSTNDRLMAVGQDERGKAVERLCKLSTCSKPNLPCPASWKPLNKDVSAKSSLPAMADPPPSWSRSLQYHP